LTYDYLSLAISNALSITRGISSPLSIAAGINDIKTITTRIEAEGPGWHRSVRSISEQTTREGSLLSAPFISLNRGRPRTQVWTPTGRDHKELDGLDGIGEGREGLQILHNHTAQYSTVHRRAYFKTGALNHSATLPSLELCDLAGVGSGESGSWATFTPVGP